MCLGFACYMCMLCQRRGFGSPELELLKMGATICVLGIKPRSVGRAASALNC